MRKLIIFSMMLLYGQGCNEPTFNPYSDVYNHINSQHEYVALKLELMDSCIIAFDSKAVPIRITPFHNIIDSLNLIDNPKNEDSFYQSNMFDLERSESGRVRIGDIDLIGREDNIESTVNLYCSDIFSNLLTCECVASDNQSPSGGISFGLSLVYLFKLDSLDRIIYLDSKLVHNN